MYRSVTLSFLLKGPLFLPIHVTVVHRDVDSDSFACYKRFGLVKLHQTNLEVNMNLK